MLRKVIAGGLSIFMTGCAPLSLPRYIPSRNVETQRFYAGYERVLPAVRQAMQEMGWQVAQEADPNVFEIGNADHQADQAILFISEPRPGQALWGSRQARLNIYIYSQGEVSDMEIRRLEVRRGWILRARRFGAPDEIQDFFARVRGLLGMPGSFDQ